MIMQMMLMMMGMMMMMIQNSFTTAVDTKTLEFQSQFEDNGWKYLRWRKPGKKKSVIAPGPPSSLTNQTNSGQF